MNITPQFVKSPPFIKFERVTGSIAYKYITLLGMYCQQSRSPDVTIEEPLDLELLIGADDNGEKILSDLLKFKLIELLDEPGALEAALSSRRRLAASEIVGAVDHAL